VLASIYILIGKNEISADCFSAYSDLDVSHFHTLYPISLPSFLPCLVVESAAAFDSEISFFFSFVITEFVRVIPKITKMQKSVSQYTWIQFESLLDLGSGS
jgi:hypothetical protein